MKTIHLKCNNKISNIYIGEILSNIKNYVDIDKTVIITDSNVIKYYPKLFPTDKIITINNGEKYKNLKTITNIIEKLIEFGADRDTFILGIGGGVVCDISGLSASIYNRGLKFGFVATTLLAQVDASIGGKNAVNFNHYKNIIGTFNQPEFVISDTNTLKTLPNKELINGFAEIIKTAVIDDENLFYILENNNIDISQQELLEEIIYRTAKIKAEIVQKDEYESGLRRILNFGHTFGHAIESVCKISHGKAVSIGISKALDISIIKLNLGTQCSDRIKSLLTKYGLPLEINYDKSKVVDALLKDKKKNSNKIKFILLKNIAKPVIEEIEIDELINYL